MQTNVAGALFYLRMTSFRNGLRSRLLRLKQPKYLLGGIVGIAYIYFFFLRRVTASSSAAPEFSTLPMVELIGAAAVLMMALFSWILPSAPNGLAFTETEIATLFPAPIRRRTLIHYRLLSAQFTLLFTALILGLVSARWHLAGNWVMRTCACWVMLATLNLHSMAASFAIARLLDLGVTAWPRRLLVIGLVAAWIAAAFWFPSVPSLAESHSLREYLMDLFASGPLAWLLAIPKIIVAPFLAPDASSFLLALGAAACVLAAHYAWVVYSEVAFEEASLASAQRRAALMASRRGDASAKARTKPRRDPFRLSAHARPEIAFLWKNLLAGSELFRPRTLAITAVIIVFGCRWLNSDPTLEPFAMGLFTLAITVLGFTLFLGPQIMRNDLRGDLINADMLKIYPLRGWQIVLGELLAPVVSLASILWLALLTITLMIPDARLKMVTPETKIWAALALATLAPALCFIQSIVMNGLTLLFPAWVQLMANRTERGFDVLGQRILFMAAQLLVVLFALVPASVVAGAVMLATQWQVGPVVAGVLAFLAVLATLVGEICIGVAWLGRHFERFDLSSELRP